MILKTIITLSKVFTITAAFCLLRFDSAHAVSMTYYDIGFSEPIHTVGSPPSEGSNPDTISNIVFGEPLVESSFGVLTNESLVFNTAGNTPSFFYDQIKLDLANNSDRYRLSFDLSTNNFVNTGSTNTFTLLFDTPEVRSISFNNNGTIRYFHPSEGSGIIGNFSDNTLLKMIVDVNLATSTWNIFMNNDLLHSGIFFPSTDDINSLRFSFGGINSSTFDSIGLDNLQITNGEDLATVPEPLTILGAGTAVAFGAGFKRKLAKAKKK